ncbi:MAG: hypothetical protein MPN21_06180 [Thermoanaerobaculia bacterium]|nr:hypothetical protein [Thermoanaerobaculia bacterium]
MRLLRPPMGTPLFEEVDVEVVVEGEQSVDRDELRFDGGRVGALTEPKSSPRPTGESNALKPAVRPEFDAESPNPGAIRRNRR